MATASNIVTFLFGTGMTASEIFDLFFLAAIAGWVAFQFFGVPVFKPLGMLRRTAVWTLAIFLLTFFALLPAINILAAFWASVLFGLQAASVWAFARGDMKSPVNLLGALFAEAVFSVAAGVVYWVQEMISIPGHSYLEGAIRFALLAWGIWAARVAAILLVKLVFRPKQREADWMVPLTLGFFPPIPDRKSRALAKRFRRVAENLDRNLYLDDWDPKRAAPEQIAEWKRERDEIFEAGLGTKLRKELLYWYPAHLPEDVKLELAEPKTALWSRDDSASIHLFLAWFYWGLIWFTLIERPFFVARAGSFPYTFAWTKGLAVKVGAVLAAWKPAVKAFLPHLWQPALPAADALAGTLPYAGYGSWGALFAWVAAFMVAALILSVLFGWYDFVSEHKPFAKNDRWPWFVEYSLALPEEFGHPWIQVISLTTRSNYILTASERRRKYEAEREKMRKKFEALIKENDDTKH